MTLPAADPGFIRSRALRYAVAAVTAWFAELPPLLVTPAQAQGGLPYGASAGTFPSIAAVAANTIPWPTIHVQGYYGPGTAGGGDLELNPNDLTSAANGCRIYVDAANHRYYRNIEPGMLPITDCGAVADNATDNSTAIETGAALLEQLFGGGTLIVPPMPVATGGVFCLKSGVDLDGLTLQLDGTLAACNGNTFPLVTLYGTKAGIIGAGTLLGKGGWTAGGETFGASVHTVAVATTCVQCRLDDFTATGGIHAVDDQGVDTRINDIHLFDDYGAAYYKANDAGWIERMQADDHSWTAGLPSYPLTIANWSASSAVTAATPLYTQSYLIQVMHQAEFTGTIGTDGTHTGGLLTVTSITGGSNFGSILAGAALNAVSGSAIPPATIVQPFGSQCGTTTATGTGGLGTYCLNTNSFANASQTIDIGAGTTGTSAPTLGLPNVPMVDGTATELTVRPFTSYAVQNDTNAEEVHYTYVDMSSPNLVAFAMTNTLSGTAPHTITLERSVPSLALDASIYLHDGQDFTALDNELISPDGANSSTVVTTTNWVGYADISHSVVFDGAAYAFFDGAGVYNSATDNPSVTGASVVAFYGTQNDLKWTGNNFSNTPGAMQVTSAVSRGRIALNDCSAISGGSPGGSNASSIPSTTIGLNSLCSPY